MIKDCYNCVWNGPIAMADIQCSHESNIDKNYKDYNIGYYKETRESKNRDNKCEYFKMKSPGELGIKFPIYKEEDKKMKYNYHDKFEVKFKRLHPDAKIPTKAKNGDICYDLYAVNKVYSTLFFNTIVVDTGIAVQPPNGYGLIVESRSGLASNGIFVVGGIIDNGYRNSIKVILASLSNLLTINKGDKIAQIRLVPIYEIDWIEVDELEETERGTDGLGSTGR